MIEVNTHNLRSRASRQLGEVEVEDKKQREQKKKKRKLATTAAAATATVATATIPTLTTATVNSDNAAFVATATASTSVINEKNKHKRMIKDAKENCNRGSDIKPTAMERYHMLALGRFYERDDVLKLQTRCRKGMWTLETLQKSLADLDTQDPINEHESREVVHIKHFLNKEEVMSINQCFDGPVRRASFQAGTDSGKAASWCKYLYIKSRKDQEVYAEFQAALTESLEERVHAEVKKSLNSYERTCFGELFPRQKAREISIVVRKQSMRITTCISACVCCIILPYTQYIMFSPRVFC
jgi:hypothetical protein